VSDGFFYNSEVIVAMKVHDFAYQVAQRTIALLEEKQHYKVSEENKKEILRLLQDEVDDLLDKSL